MKPGEVWHLDTISGAEVPVVILAAAMVEVPGGGVTVATLGDPEIAPDTILSVPITAAGLVARCYDIRTVPPKRFAEKVGTCTPAELESIRTRLRAYFDL